VSNGYKAMRTRGALPDPDPHCGGLRLFLEALEFQFALEQTGDVEPSAPGFQHLRVEQRPVLEEHVRAAIAARSRERIVLPQWVDLDRRLTGLQEHPVVLQFTTPPTSIDCAATFGGGWSIRLPRLPSGIECSSAEAGDRAVR
jgi:hypothetical protein